MSRSIDGPECKHGHNLFDPTICPECEADLDAARTRLHAHPAFKRVLERADFKQAERMVFAESNPGPPSKGWPELIGSGNPEAGDYAAGLRHVGKDPNLAAPYGRHLDTADSPWRTGMKAAEEFRSKHPELDRLHDLTHAYVQATIRGLRYRALRKLVLRALDMLASMPNPMRRKADADEALGKWMAAALDDPNVCAEMKADINEWFEAIENAKLAKTVFQQVREAQMVMRAERAKWKQDTFLEHYGTGHRFIGIDLAGSEPVAVHCTACGKDEPCAADCANCEVPHCPIRPLRERKPKHAARHAVKSLKAHPKRKTHARRSK